ncbi:MAG: glycosyltransferase family 4 protein, partial [Terrimicrobiaceae bacterium]
MNPRSVPCCIQFIENPKSIPRPRDQNRKLRVALCMEYPLKQWGGVEVLVKELLSGLSQSADILLASDDTPESLSESRHAEFVTSHFRWDPSLSYPAQARDLSAWLVGNRADLVHFHLGGTYAFQTRSWAQSPIPIVAKSGIPCVSTNHGAFSLFDFCGPQRSLAERLLMLPIFWVGRAKTLLALRREVTVSDNDLGNMRRWYFPLGRKFQRIYHSQLSGNEGVYDEREKSIVCLGTVGPRKGQPFLVEAFAQVAERFPEWNLVIAGRLNSGADEVRRMESIIERENFAGRVRLVGAVSPSEAHRPMQS